MILRLSQKLNAKIKAGKLTDMPLDENLFADWSSHLFTVNRAQYIILTHTRSLYSCVMHGRDIPHDAVFISRALETLRDFTIEDRLPEIFQQFIAPSTATVRFAKAFNRSVTSSMNELVADAKYALMQEMAPSEVGYRLNKRPMTALVGPKGERYGFPRDVFASLADRMIQGGS